MLAVLFAALAGCLFGALAVAVRQGLHRNPDANAGALVIAGGAAIVSIVPAAFDAGQMHVGDLWPFALSGLLVPGVSQLLFVLSVRDIGPSRASMLIGTAPLMSVLVALVLLGEPFRPELLGGTMLVVAGGAALARERVRPEHFRAFGIVLGLICAVMFAVRDNLVRWGARDTHPPPLLAATTSLLAAGALLLVFLLVRDRKALGTRLRRAVPAFAPAAILLAVSYDLLFEAFDRGRVSIVAPLNATQSLWAVVFAALVVGAASEAIGRRLVVAGLLIVGGGALIGVVR
ncbi:MAG TPA: DMT family transporter [Gaiellaceae bacterium]